MLSERAEFVAAAFAATTNSGRESKHLHLLVPLQKFSRGWPGSTSIHTAALFSPDRDPPASWTLFFGIIPLTQVGLEVSSAPLGLTGGCGGVRSNAHMAAHMAVVRGG
jgi:hypothetical protein